MECSNVIIKLDGVENLLAPELIASAMSRAAMLLKLTTEQTPSRVSVCSAAGLVAAQRRLMRSAEHRGRSASHKPGFTDTGAEPSWPTLRC